MTLETKKELLRYRIFMSSFHCDISTYHLIKYKFLDSFIEEIEEDTFYVKSDIKDGEINAERFILLLEYIVTSIRERFSSTFISVFIIEEIMKSDKDLLSEYFHYKGHFTGMGSNSELNRIIRRLIITNFIANSKYIDFIEPLLNDINIPLKQINEYTEKEVSSILGLIDDILFCQKAGKHCNCLFENINQCLELNLSILKERRKKIYNDEKLRENHINKFIQDYYKSYEILINNYNRKKEYLKYFR